MVKNGSVAPDLPIPLDKISWMQDQLVVLGQIPKAGDVKQMVDIDVRDQALARAARE